MPNIIPPGSVKSVKIPVSLQSIAAVLVQQLQAYQATRSGFQIAFSTGWMEELEVLGEKDDPEELQQGKLIRRL